MRKRKLLYVTDVSKSSHILSVLDRGAFEITIRSSFILNQGSLKIPKMLRNYLPKFLGNRVEEIFINVKYKSIGMHQFFIPFLRHVLNVTSGRQIISFLNNLTRLKLLLTTWKYDIIITTEEVFPFLTRKNQVIIVEVRGNLPICTELRCPTILGAPFEAFEGSKEFRFHWTRILKRADGFLVYSTSTLKQLELSGVNSKIIGAQELRNLKIRDNSQFLNNFERKIQVLYVGRDGALKGLDLAVAVALDLGVNLAVVGNFSRKTTSWLNQFDFVSCYGSIDHNEVLELMAKSHILLSPGIESFGYAILEALESGCLVVSSKFCGAAAMLASNPNVFLSTSIDLPSFSKTVKIAMNQNFQNTTNTNPDLNLQTWKDLIEKLLNA